MSRRPRTPPTLFRRGLARWLAIVGVTSILLLVYQTHPYYHRVEFAPWRPLSVALFVAWLALGLPYAIATVRRFGSLKIALTDPALHYLIVARALWHAARTRGPARWRPVRRAFRARRVRTSILALAVKAFFLPLMTIFLSGHLGALAALWARGHGIRPFAARGTEPVFPQWLAYARVHVWTYFPSRDDVAPLASPGSWTLDGFRRVLEYYYNLLFAVDCGWSLMGYASESRWLGNKTRSVEPTGLGWLVALMCYPPFNDVTGVYIPLNAGPPIFHSVAPQLVCRVLMLLAFTVYVAATVSCGMKFSNLTNRGIVSRGPYRFMRHPAYVCKGFAWWMENLPTLTFPTAVFLVAINGVYAMRAWTEERHLSRDPDYRAYKKKVRWVLVPGIY